MTPEEARVKIGWTELASVYHAIRTGQIKARENGDLVEASVDKFIAKRAENAEERALFLKGQLTPTEQERYRTLVAARMAKRSKR